jgi:hypothetical protein
MKLLRCSLASLAVCSATLALAVAPASAEISLVNAGFETGNTTGWHGTGAVTAGYGAYTAPAGSYFGLVRSPGCPGETLQQDFTADAGDRLTGWAFFSTGDYLPYDDYGDVRIVVERTATDTIVFSSSVAEVGSSGATPWTEFTYKVQSSGSYRIQLHVENGTDCSTESAVGLDMDQGSIDDDTDAISDDADNCPGIANPDQLNHDGDEQGDACDGDDDNDTFDDASDNCPLKANSAQADTDADGQGDACDADDDGDMVDDTADNCQLVANAEQTDTNADGQGDACDGDDDGDMVDDDVDNCQLAANTVQSDNDADRQGDACDADDDNDGVLDERDNCPMMANPRQRDDDRDGIGNACDEAFDSNAGKASAGGWLRHDGERVSVSVSAKSKHGVLAGTCRVRTRHTAIKCTSLDGYHYDAAEHTVVLVGAATIDGVPTHYRIVLRDGVDDHVRVTTDSGFAVGGILNAGKVRIRQG